MVGPRLDVLAFLFFFSLYFFNIFKFYRVVVIYKISKRVNKRKKKDLIIILRFL